MNQLTWKVVVTLPSVSLHLFTSQIAELYSISTIYLFADNRDLFLDGQVEIIQEFKA